MGCGLHSKAPTEQPNVSYLHERDHKRELRLESAQEGTRITQSEHEDLQRNMVFALRRHLCGTLQAKYILDLAKADLDYYDKIIDISREIVSRPATSARSIWTASNCCACSTSRKLRPRS